MDTSGFRERYPQTWVKLRQATSSPGSGRLAAEGPQDGILAGLLGQTQLATTQRYAHLDLDPRRRAAEAVAGQLEHLLHTQHDGRAA